MTTSDWAVYRQDFTGNEFLVESGLTEHRARELVVEFESHKHHQHYWADKQPDPKPDFAKLLSKMLASGSPLGLSLPVLRTQGATDKDCILAIGSACDLSRDKSEEIVQRPRSEPS